MRLNSLRLQNFRQHADSFITFDAGLTGIIGANGSGKTTILEAIAWALHGQDAARGQEDAIRSLRDGEENAPPARPPGPGAGVKGERDFGRGGPPSRVERGLTTAELYLDGA